MGNSSAKPIPANKNLREPRDRSNLNTHESGGRSPVLSYVRQAVAVQKHGAKDLEAVTLGPCYAPSTPGFLAPSKSKSMRFIAVCFHRAMLPLFHESSIG